MKIQLKWYICGLLFIATVISYIDRQAFGLVAPVVAKEFNFTNQEVALIAGAFLLAYAFGQMGAGKVIDHLGSRLGFSLAISLWSVAQMCTALASGVLTFSTFRFLLGLGESGNFPGGIKVLARWFSSDERSFAVGIFSSGGSIGAIIAPPLIAFIIVHWGWRPAFVSTGILGFLWLLGWLAVHRSDKLGDEEEKGSDHHASLETAKPAGNPIPEARPEPESHIPWIDLFRHKQVLGVTFARFFEEPLAWFYLTWLPKYLVEYRGFEIMQMGVALTIPYITLDLGYIAGGWISYRLVRRGYSLSSARKSVMVGSCLLMMCSIPAPFVAEAFVFIALVSVATMAHGLWTANALTLPADLVSPRLVGSVYGITATGGGLGGFLFMQITGIVADRTRSFESIFVAVGLLPLLAALVVLFGIGKVQTLKRGKDVAQSRDLGAA
jgi:ACS family hexuronate transporter-like MFS transporter